MGAHGHKMWGSDRKVYEVKRFVGVGGHEGGMKETSSLKPWSTMERGNGQYQHSSW